MQTANRPGITEQLRPGERQPDAACCRFDQLPHDHARPRRDGRTAVRYDGRIRLCDFHVLQVDPDNQAALVGLLLARTDQFSHDGAGGLAQAREVLPRIRDDYERAYYAGIICERRAKALLDGAKLDAGSMAHILLREAKGWYEQAEQLRPPGNDDVLLRWNACARLVLRFPQVAAAPEERYEPYSDV